MSIRAFVLVLVLLVSQPALADVYADAKQLAAAKGSAESPVQAAKRWQKGLARLNAVPVSERKDYRYCYWRAVLTFRLSGADAMKTERYDCTSLQVAGTRADSKVTTPEDRAEAVNALSALAEDFYKEKILYLTLQLAAAKKEGGGKVVIAWAKVKQLKDSGKLSEEDAKAVLNALEDASKGFDRADFKLDPGAIDFDKIDWKKMKKEDLDKIPTDVKEQIKSGGFESAKKQEVEGRGSRK